MCIDRSEQAQALMALLMQWDASSYQRVIDVCAPLDCVSSAAARCQLSHARNSHGLDPKGATNLNCRNSLTY